MDIFEVYKNKIGERLASRLADALRNGEVNEDDASEISGYVLDNIDNKKDNIELFSFLEELAKKWPIFGSIIAADQKETLNVAQDTTQN